MNHESISFISPHILMFCGNDEAVEIAAIAYFLLGSCRLAKVYP